MKLQFARNAYQSRSRPINSQRLVNLYAEANPPDSKEPLVLIGTPGLKLFADLGDKSINGLHVMKGTLFAVVGADVYTVNAAGIGTLIGDIGINEQRVEMEDNGTQVVILKEDGTAYVATTASVVQITDVDFRPASSVTFMDGYHVFTERDSQVFFISGLNDALSYDALDFASAESKPDDLVRVFSDHSELWLFGVETIEVWYNSGAADFPFARISGAVIERGCGAADSVAKEDNTVFWLGDDGIVYRADGYTPKRISTHAIEFAIAGYSTTSDAYGFVYDSEGHKFYVLTFPSNGATWVFDIATGLWHERESFGLNRWRVNSFAFNFEKNLVGDFENGKIYELDLDTYDENGEILQKIAVSAPLANENMRFIVDKFTLELDVGVGLTLGQGKDPQVMMQWSDDGGYTWSNEYWRDIGKKGEYTTEVRWRALGQTRQRMFRTIISDPIKVAIQGAYIDIRMGKS